MSDALQEATTKALNALRVVSHQAAACSLVNALLVREVDGAGLIDRAVLRAEAVARAERLGPGVVAVVGSVFGGEPPPPPEIPTRAPFTMIRSGLLEPE